MSSPLVPWSGPFFCRLRPSTFHFSLSRSQVDCPRYVNSARICPFYRDYGIEGRRPLPEDFFRAAPNGFFFFSDNVLGHRFLFFSNPPSRQRYFKDVMPDPPSLLNVFPRPEFCFFREYNLYCKTCERIRKGSTVASHTFSGWILFVPSS